MIKLSERSVLIQPQPMFRILAQAKALELAGKSIIHFEIGDTSFFSNTEIESMFHTPPNVKVDLGYSPSAGESRLREVLAENYSILCGEVFSIANVVVTPANAAISQLLAILCDKGEKVLLGNPSFPTYKLAIDFNELEAVYFDLIEAKGFEPDLEAIQKRIESDPKIRAMIIDNPSNPLGIYHDEGIMNALATLCNKHRVALIIDDTYKSLIYLPTYDRIKHFDTNFYIYSLSKEAAAPALRIGGVVGDERVITKVADYNSMFYSCLSKPLQLAAVNYLNGPQKRLGEIRAEMIERIDKVSRIFLGSPYLSFVKPNAAIYLYLNISQTRMSSDDFSTQLLTDTGVCVCPGSAFGPSGYEYVRICLSGNDSELYSGCAKIVEFVNSKKLHELKG
jgi:aspartate/methionine/tyrosine aminotransferase